MKKIKLLPSILMLVLCVGILAIGVYAASPITGTINGTINITAASGVKIAVYRGASTAAANLIDSAFGSSEVELAAGGATLDASSATNPEQVTAQVYTVVLSTNQSTNYVVDTETIQVVDGVGVTSGEKVSGAAVITKLHKPTANTTDANGNACFTKDKPYTIQISIKCGKVSTEAISVGYDIDMAIYTEADYTGTGVNGVDYLYFGEYPQAEASVTAGDLTADGVFYGYDDDKTSETAGGKVARPAYTDGTNRYVLFNSKYYQIQPLKWRILNQAADGTTRLMCDTIVEQVYFQQFYETDNYYYATDKNGAILQENGNNAYANNYNVSILRNYLIDTFYNGAFSTSEQVIIKSEEGQVDNSAASHGTLYSSETYACENTNDPVFAPSVAEVTNSTYGFGTDEESSDDTRKITASDYATATGVYSSNGSGNWWLRSPYSGQAYSARCVRGTGIVNGLLVKYDNPGCVPALLLGL